MGRIIVKRAASAAPFPPQGDFVLIAQMLQVAKEAHVEAARMWAHHCKSNFRSYRTYLKDTTGMLYDEASALYSGRMQTAWKVYEGLCTVIGVEPEVYNA